LRERVEESYRNRTGRRKRWEEERGQMREQTGRELNLEDDLEGGG